MQKVLIIDNSEAIVLSVCEKIKDCYQTACCCDGTQALSVLEQCQPDYLILDLSITGCDALDLLNSAEKLPKRPTVLVTTYLLNQYIRNSLERYGVAYLLRKPCQPETIAAHLMRLEDYRTDPQIPTIDEKKYTRDMLVNLGLSAKVYGFRCLCIAIPMVMNNPELSFSYDVYPDIAKITGRNWRHVERGIRAAVDKAWSERDEGLWNAYFPADQNQHIKKPTNGVFISRLAQMLREQMEREELL